MLYKILQWLSCLPLLLKARKNIDALAVQEIVVSAQIAALKSVCDEQMEKLGELHREAEKINNDIFAAKEMRSHAVRAALRRAEIQAADIIRMARDRAAEISNYIIADAQDVSNRLMTGAENYAAEIRDTKPAEQTEGRAMAEWS